MRIFSILLSCLFLNASLLHAQDEKPKAEPKPASSETVKESPLKTLKERASYGIGQNLAAQIKFEKNLDLDFEIVIQGFRDKLKDNEPLLTDEQIQDTMIELRAVIQRKALEGQKMAAEENAKAGKEFLAKNKKKEGITTTESGLQYEVLKKGKGTDKPKPKDTVTTHYHGTLIDGTVFDSSVDRGEPVSFPVNGVIKGWTEALQLMSVGDKYKLYIPSELAYGNRGAGEKIGPGAALVFEVELLEIESADK